MTRAGRGFNLIEAAIVLAVVGLVIGGIWTAAASVRQNMRVNEIAATIVQVSTGVRSLMPKSSWPTVSGTSVALTSTAFHAKLFPASFVLNGSGTVVYNSTGSAMATSLGCWSICPMINVVVLGPAHSSKGELGAADCIQVIRRLAVLAKDREDFIYAQLAIPGNAGYLYLYPPINPAAVQCPDNLEYINFWFKP